VIPFSLGLVEWQQWRRNSIMTQVEAIYQNGVFKPLRGVELPENQRVRLSFQPIDAGDVRAWLTRVQQRQQEMIAQGGYLPDSTLDIAEDRMR
jgi:predicted DNA-binding antitoxin AbrB/MazE fold protein